MRLGYPHPVRTHSLSGPLSKATLYQLESFTEVTAQDVCPTYMLYSSNTVNTVNPFEPFFDKNKEHMFVGWSKKGVSFGF